MRFIILVVHEPSSVARPSQVADRTNRLESTKPLIALSSKTRFISLPQNLNYPIFLLRSQNQPFGDTPDGVLILQLKITVTISRSNGGRKGTAAAKLRSSSSVADSGFIIMVMVPPDVPFFYLPGLNEMTAFNRFSGAS
jgi:hypothetical protein